MKPNLPTVLIAKYSKIVADYLAEQLELRGFTVIAKTTDSNEALRLLLAHKPQIAIIDYELEPFTGIEVVLQTKLNIPKVRFIIFSKSRKSIHVLSAFRWGVHGYLHHDTPLIELIDCIGATLRDSQYIAKSIRETLITDDELFHYGNNLSEKVLTDQEQVIFRMIAQSKTSKEIARALTISINTVNNHRANIKQKLQLEGGKLVLFLYAKYLSSSQD